MFHLVLSHLINNDDPRLFKDLVQRLKNTTSEGQAIRNVLEPACVEAARRLTENHKVKDSSLLATRLSNLMRFASDSSFKSLYRPLVEHPRTEHSGKFPSTIYRALVRDTSHGGDDQEDLPVEHTLVKNLRLQYLQAIKERNVDADYLDVVIDVPYGKARRNMIHVLVTSTGEEEEITAVSNLAHSIFTQPAAFTSPVRAFVSPRIVDQLNEVELKDVVTIAEERFWQGKETAEEKPAI